MSFIARPTKVDPQGTTGSFSGRDLRLTSDLHSSFTGRVDPQQELYDDNNQTSC